MLVIPGKTFPWMRRNQGFIDRCFYRLKYGIWETLAQFAAVIQNEADMISLTGELLGVVEKTL
jgi:hypothetical protein